MSFHSLRSTKYEPESEHMNFGISWCWAKDSNVMAPGGFNRIDAVSAIASFSRPHCRVLVLGTPVADAE